MKKNSTKFFAVVLVVAMLAAQFAFPVTAANSGSAATPNPYYCSVCGDKAVLDVTTATPARTIETCGATYKIYNCAYDADGDATTTNDVCTGTITVVSAGTDVHTPDGKITEAKPATCTEAGNVAYQGCVNCDVKLDANTAAVLSTVVIDATGHTLENVPQKDNGCLTDGLKAHTKCKVCGGLFADGAAGNPEDPTIVPEVIPGHDHDFSVKHDAVPANCRDKGYTEYYTCSVCQKEDPTRSKTETPVINHGFGIVNDATLTYPATCTTDGQNFFKCNDPAGQCPYLAGVAETLPKLGHDLTLVPAVDPKCETAGNHAYYTCSRCAGSKFEVPQTGTLILPADKNTAGYADILALNVAAAANYDPAIAAVGHVKVAIDFKKATCNTDGLVDAIACTNTCCEEYDAVNGYGKIFYAGDVEPAFGHDFSFDAGFEADCKTPGEKAHYECSVCLKNYVYTEGVDLELPAVTDPNYATIYAANIKAVVLEDIVIPATGHNYKMSIQEPTCTDIGYEIYTCQEFCNYADRVYSVVIPATGHKFEAVGAVAPDCWNAGCEAYQKCANEGCTLLIKAGVDGANYKTEDVIPVTDANDNGYPDAVEVAKLNHGKRSEVPEVAPTYTEAGNTAGQQCDYCGSLLNGATVIPELQESIKFHFDIDAVKGDDIAVNSGYITVDIYFDVVAAANDTYENSEVFAKIFAIDLPFTFRNDAFELTSVVLGGAFDFGSFTNLKKANNDSVVTITQDMGTEDARVFTGKNIHVATLKFQVKSTTAAGQYNFALATTGVVAGGYDENAGVIVDEVIDTTGSVTSVDLTVKKLGDANTDTDLTSVDTKKISDYIKSADVDTAYKAEYDLNKDGVIDFGDLALLRQAIAGENEDYLKPVAIP